jgi:hypothetical protein
MCFYSGRFDGIAQYMRAAPLYIEHALSRFVERLFNEAEEMLCSCVNQHEASIFCIYNITSIGKETIYRNKI